MSRDSETRTFIETVIACTSRLICVAALAWFGLIVANAIGSLKRPDKIANEDQSGAIDINFNEPEFLMPVAGYWSFAQTGLSIQQIVCSEKELAGRMENLHSHGDSPTEPTRDASDLVRLARLNGAVQTICESGSVWSFADSHLRICLVTTNSQTPRLRAAAFAVKAAQQWQLTILKPQPPLDDHLLPLPSESESAGSQSELSKTTCTRRNEAGELQMEFISTPLSNEQLLNHWRDRGWDIRHTTWGTADSFSYLCARDDNVVYAWSDDSTGWRTLMLTASEMTETTTPETNYAKLELTQREKN